MQVNGNFHCPRTTMYVHSFYYLCVLICCRSCNMQANCNFSADCMPHTTPYVSSYYYIRVPILLCMCVQVVQYGRSQRQLSRRLDTSYYCICVLILLHTCPHTTAYVSSYYCIRAPILLCMCVQVVQYGSQRQLPRRLDALIQISDPSAAGEWRSRAGVCGRNGLHLQLHWQ
jgi:hypothetical protein